MVGGLLTWTALERRAGARQDADAHTRVAWASTDPEERKGKPRDDLFVDEKEARESDRCARGVATAYIDW